MYTELVDPGIARILITREQLARRVRELGALIAADLHPLVVNGEEIVIVPVLSGSIVFVADLMREIPLRIRMSLVTVRSYQGVSTAPNGPSLRGDLPNGLSGRHVLIVDDILDSGRTLRMLREEIANCCPRSIRSCVLLRKNLPSALATPCEYVGFDIGPEFVVGYGLDYNDYFRNLPDVATLREPA